MRSSRAFAFLILFLLPLLQDIPQGIVHAQSSAASEIYVSPIATCCQFNQSSFTIAVMLNLTAGEGINVFDVRLDYTGFWSVSTNKTGIVQAQAIDYTGNIFGAGDVVFECIDGVVASYQARCSGRGDHAGQVNFSEGAPGNTVMRGPLNAALLFRVTFTVHNNGTSVFSFDTADLVNPSPDPSNQFLLNPHSIPLVRFGGIFANRGLAAFFNYEPSVSSVVLPGQNVRFDASSSFNGTVSTGLINPRFSWNFGDGQLMVGQVSSIALHPFAVPGSYPVQLNVTEGNGAFGSYSRTVSVVSALGAISLKVNNPLGTPIIGGIRVSIFNSSSTLSLLEKTIDNQGRVNFTSLSPADYLLKFSGAGYQDSSKTETVKPGLTTPDNVYLLFVPPPVPNYVGGIVLVSVIVTGLGLGTVAFVVRKRRIRQASRVKSGRLKK